MAKRKSRLHEKAARLPDITEAQKRRAITKYRKEVQAAQSEAAKSHCFTALLDRLFGVEPGFIEQYVSGIERHVRMRRKDRIVRGRADQLSGNLIIEFERDLAPPKKQEEAEAQLRMYTACAWAEEPRTPFVCLATDGQEFHAHAPVPRTGATAPLQAADIELKPLEALDATAAEWRDFYLFLDRYLLRKEVLPPTSENVVKDFGPHSHVLQVAERALLDEWARLKKQPAYAVRYDTWAKYLRIVYGSPQAEEELFVRHTYLATVAKLMVWTRFAPNDHPPDRDTLHAVLEGTYFKHRLSVENFLEEDLFSWLARPEAQGVGHAVARDILSIMANYNFRELSEDVLKALYEGLVDPATRHDLGEYYTPDWLAHRIVRKALQNQPEASLLDPACGSGTFLYMTIREKRGLLGKTPARLTKHIVATVVGMDIHPLAVIVAKANYVLALGHLMTRRKSTIRIPVYMANSIRPPVYEVRRELWHKVPCYRAEVADTAVHIPQRLSEDPEKCDEAMEAAHDFAAACGDRSPDEQAFQNYLANRHPDLCDEGEGAVLFSVAHTFHQLMTEGRNSIWVFVLKNIYRPLFLEDHFDLLVGNPPWLSYRHVEQPDYQKFLKRQITSEYGLVQQPAQHLITHLELGTLFLLRCADLYLKDGGQVAFLLPKSIFSADQHHALRAHKFKRPRVAMVRAGEGPVVPRLSVRELWDLEAVAPLFNTSAAVLFAQKNPPPSPLPPIPGEIATGELPIRNAPLPVAEHHLATRAVQFQLTVRGQRSFWSTQTGRQASASLYKKDFAQGASIVPRCFWFVELQHSGVGFDQSCPPLISAQRARRQAKGPYKRCVVQGQVESEFLYATLLPADMVPFGFLRLRPVVLPLRVREGRFVLCQPDQARREGFLHLAQWLERVEAEWKARRGQKARNMTAIEWLDYRRKLTQQDPKAAHRVLYATSGTNVCSCAVRTCVAQEAGLANVRCRAFVVDYTTYSAAIESQNHAHYVAASEDVLFSVENEGGSLHTG
ncbi:MAG: N-6 DNA methylase, partial [Planctomycetota bacterium]